MKRRRWPVFLVVAGLCLVYFVIAIRAGRKKQAVGVEVEIATAKRGELVVTVTGSGVVRAEDKTEVRAEITGVLAEVLVEEGERVAQGAVLCRFADRELKKAIEDAESALTAARVQLDNLRLRIDEGRYQVRQAEQTLAKARLAMADAEKAYERLSRLFEKGAVSNEQVEAASSQLTGAKLQASQAESAYQQALVAAKVLEGEEKLAALRVKDAERALAGLRADLTRTVVRAPRGGVVLSCPVKPGMSVPIGTELCTIGTTDRLVVELPVDQVDIVKIKTGQPATITHEGLPGVKIRGQVAAVPPQAVEAGGERAFLVRVVLDNREGLLRPGMTVEVEIVTAHLKKVITVPLLAVLEEDKDDEIRHFIFRVEGEKAVKTPVVLGLNSENEAEIKEGLAEGDRYVTGDYETILHLKDGTKVKEKKKTAGGTGGK